jgi:outer membrane protein assembly factor BamB
MEADLPKTVIWALTILLCHCSEPGGEPRTDFRKKNTGLTAAAKSKSRAPASPLDGYQTPIAQKSGWTTFRGNHQRTGRAPANGPRSPRLKWVFRTQGRIYADAAVAPDGTVYTASFDNYLYAVGPDGREIWSYDAKGKIWTSPAIAPDGTIYFGSDADRFIALDPSGKERWIFSTEQHPQKGEKPEAGRYDVDTSAAIAADGTIVFGCNTALLALKPSGDVRWVYYAGSRRAKIFSSPALGHDGTIYFGTQGRLFFALDQGSSMLWFKKTGSDNDSTPAVGDNDTVYFASDDGKVRSCAHGGELRWETDLKEPVRAPISIGYDGTVFVSTYSQKPYLAALDGRTGAEKWRFYIQPSEGAFYGIQSGALVDPDGYVYFGARDHQIYCLSPRGELVWNFETGDEVDSGPVMGPDGTLYVGSDDKRLYAFAPDGA